LRVLFGMYRAYTSKRISASRCASCAATHAGFSPAASALLANECLVWYIVRFRSLAAVMASSTTPDPEPSWFCYWHSPRVSPEERHATAVKGGLMSRHKVLPAEAADVRLTSPEACLALLQESVSQMRRGTIDIKVMNSIAYSVTAACRVWEVAISAKLNKLERMVRGRGRR
jgi:hypothetical protein